MFAALGILKDIDEEIEIKHFKYYYDILPYLFNTNIDHKKTLEIREKLKNDCKNHGQKQWIEVMPIIKEVYVDKNLFCCFYSFFKNYNNKTIVNEYFKDCINFLKLMYLKKHFCFEIKTDIALQENLSDTSTSNENIKEIIYSSMIIEEINVPDIEKISKEELYKKITKIIKQLPKEKILVETAVGIIYDYWYTELSKIKEYLKTSIMANYKNFKSLLIKLIKSQENKEINSMTVLFILNSFADKDLNKKRKQFLKVSKKDFIKNASFDMVVISYGLLEKNIMLFSKDKALQDYCVKLYDNLNDIKYFIEIIRLICEKNKIQYSKEIHKLAQELFNKLNNN